MWPRLRSPRSRSARLLGVVGVALAAVVLWPYPASLLDPTALASVRIVDREGRLLHEARSRSGGYGRWVGLDEISPWLVLATVSSEDRFFRWHLGVDPTGVGRALWLDVSGGRLAYGGSTVTQQLAKMLQPRPRTLPGKLAEAVDAARLEVRFSKDEILEQYLNRAYYGRLTTGVEAASERWFGKHASALGLDEAVLLAILPRAPNAYDLERFPERALRRRAHVLAQLAARGWVPADLAAKAAAVPIRLVDPVRAPRARHVLDALPAALLDGSSPVVVTTIDVELQERLETRLRDHLADLEGREADQAAVVVLDNATGDVLAMLGSRRYDEPDASGAVNAALAPRPPGSTLKPFVYALAIRDGASASTPVLDVPTVWRGFRPRNAHLDHAGLVSLKDALGSSLNVPAVRTADQVGIERFAGLLDELRIGAGTQPESLGLALGSAPVRLVDLANAYATLARGGVERAWRLLGPEQPPASARRVLDAASAFQVTRILSDARARRREFGVETPLELPFPAAVKTGTSKSFCDDFVVGYTPAVTVAVWVGNFDGRPMHALVAMQGAAPLWRDAMLAAMEHRAPREFETPAGVETAEVCPLSGMRRGPDCPAGHRELVSSRHLPTETCTWHGPGGALRMPAELRSFRDAGDGPAPAPGRGIEITSPLDDARLVVDPLLPRSRQQLRLRAAVRAEHALWIRWEVDGQLLAEVAAPFVADWPLQAGPHRVRAVALGRDDAAEPPLELGDDEVLVEVNGGRR